MISEYLLFHDEFYKISLWEYLGLSGLWNGKVKYHIMLVYSQVIFFQFFFQ